MTSCRLPWKACGHSCPPVGATSPLRGQMTCRSLDSAQQVGARPQGVRASGSPQVWGGLGGEQAARQGLACPPSGPKPFWLPHVGKGLEPEARDSRDRRT